jgi:hypothetical protein
MGRSSVLFWVLGAALVGYVALCTGQRDRVWEADAWEHHRALRAFADAPFMPGNPTFESDAPSIRYSLYTAGLATIVRGFGIDPYDVLSGAAVANTALLIVSLWFLLKRFGESAAASCVLLVMVGLWGGPPGYANSYALADLPWHQVNPSAFSFPLIIFMWTMYLGASWVSLPAMCACAAIALNSHPMTGAFGLYATVLLAFSGPRAELPQQVVRLAIISTASLVGCAIWPWFDFVAALKTTRDQQYWFNAGIVRIMLLQWCAPALLGGLLTLLIASRESVRRCLLCAAGVFVLTVFTLPLGSATLARFPMPGLIFLHTALGVMIYETGVLAWRTWPERIRALRHGTREAAGAHAVIEVAIAGMLAFYTLPQLVSIPLEWHLGKAYVARMLGRSDANHPHLKPRFDRLLEGIVKQHDVVLSDPITSWPIPSSSGKIVPAIHYEAFVDGQLERIEDARMFFGETGGVDRTAILDRYHVRYIVLNRTKVSAIAWEGLLREQAVLRRYDNLVLMSAERWRDPKRELAAHHATPDGSESFRASHD